MALNIEFKEVVPLDVLLDPPATSGQSILSKQEVWINPTDQTEYDTSGNKIINFYMSSLESFLNGPETYIQLKIRVNKVKPNLGNEITFSSSNNPGIPWNSQINFGSAGYLSLFKNIKLYSAASGEIIEKLDYANFVQSWKNYLRGNIRDAFGESGRSPEYYTYGKSENLPMLPVVGSLFAINFATTTQYSTVVIGTNSNFVADFRAGDILALGGLRFKVLFIESNTLLHCDPLFIGTNVSYAKAFVIRHENFTGVIAALSAIEGQNRITMSNYVAYKNFASVSHPSCLEPNRIITIPIPLEFFKYNIPMFLLSGGLRLELEVDNENTIFQFGGYASDSQITSCQISITNVIMKAQMLLPHPDITAEYQKQYMSSGGLLYKTPGYRVRRVGGLKGDGSTTVVSAVGVKSCRRVSCVIRDSTLHDFESLANARSDSFNIWLQSGVLKYAFRVGSSSFPAHGVLSEDVHKQVGIVFKRAFTDSNPESYQPVITDGSLSSNFTSSYAKVYGTSSGYYDRQNFLMCADLSRDNSISGDLTGIDLTSLNLELELTRGTGGTTIAAHSDLYAGTPMFYFIFEFDSYIRITPEGISALQ